MSLTGLLFIAAFFLGCALAFVRHPIYGLMTYVGVFYLHPPSRWWGQGMLEDIRWAFLAAGVTLLALLVGKTRASGTPVFRSVAFWGFVALVGWVGVQSFWALDSESHQDLLSIYVKFILVMIMVCRCIETEQHLRIFLWTHVLGCFYLGWLAFAAYSGGRLDGVGGPGINEANAAALQIVTGIVVAGSLLLIGTLRDRIALFGAIPFMVNALVMTISRSGFLALAAAGIAYNVFCPSKHRRLVRALSVLALVLLALLAHESYWERISTISFKGEEIEGIDTGGGRLEIIAAQWRMFEGHPLGCGHMCTTFLSPSFLDARYLSFGEARASHNTIMTMLVDHGIPGGVFYFAMLFWILRSLVVLSGRLKGSAGLLAATLPAIAAAFAAITIGDLFVQYPKLEVRVWFLSLLVVMLHMSAPERSGNSKNGLTLGLTSADKAPNVVN